LPLLPFIAYCDDSERTVPFPGIDPLPDTATLPEAETAASDAQTNPWLAWREPRRVDAGFEHPYHHALIEVKLPDQPETKAICPIDLPEDTDFEKILWRPMPWAIEGGRSWRYFGKLEPDSVFVGKDGHLFHRINNVCEQIFEGGGLTEEGCCRWVETLQRRVEWCEKRKIEYRVIIIPEHHAIYPDKIPGNPTPAADRPVMRTLQAADQRLRTVLIYPLDAMRSGRAIHETSYPNDVHFTRYGAFLCYREIMRTLPDFTPERIVREEELTRRTVMIGGDVARAFGVSGSKCEWFDPPSVETKVIVKGSSFKTNQVDVFETNEKFLPKCVMFRTSNSSHLFPFLLRHFSRITAVATLRMFFDLIESESPNVVISELPERYLAGRGPRWVGDRDLCGVPDDDAPSTFEEITGHPLPLPRGGSH
jgi:hypothetical protein